MENGNGIALIFARTGNRVWQEMMLTECDAVLFLRKRIKFYRPDGTQEGASGCDSALFAIGEANVQALRDCSIEGVFVPLKGVIPITDRLL